MPAFAPPRIGITTYRESASWGAWQQPADLLSTEYADAVRAAGGAVVLLPPGSSQALGDAEAVLGGVHGLLVAGGADVDPARYGQSRQPNTDAPRTTRDEWEFALIRTAIDAGIPLFGVCRGLQVLNVVLGGTLFQHLPDVVGTTLHCSAVGHFSSHRVRSADESYTATVIGAQADVPTHHHQAIDQLAPGLVATAWADDGIVEAVELPGKGWVLGVQWHPEVDGGSALFEAFVTAAVAYRDGVAVDGEVAPGARAALNAELRRQAVRRSRQW